MKPIQWLFIAVFSLYAETVLAQWPKIAFPQNARVETVGNKVRLNGVPMRMYQVKTSESVESIEQFYRDKLGKKHARRRLENSLILSQAREQYFITVRITPVAKRLTEVLISVSDMKAAKEQANRPIGFKLPRGSKVLSDMESDDNGKYARQLVYVNRHAADVNAKAMTVMMRDKGYTLSPAQVQAKPEQKILAYQGKNKEANAVIVYKKGYSSVVLTTVETP